ncbi:glycosyl hydrolase family 92 protein [Hirsutella rhossiliensis]
MSTAQACKNAEAEIGDFDFQATRATAEKAWRKKLSVVSVDNSGISKSIQRSFWSSIYRSFISPQDYTGENPLWQSDEPYFDSYYCIWDSHRTTHPLLTLLDPHAQALMVRSLIDIYRHEGKLPDCRMSLCKGLTQGGSNADNVLADSYLKGLKDGIDWKMGYEAVVSDAEVQPRDWTVEGRGGLRSWKSLGYIPVDDNDFQGVGLHTRSVSRTIEYAYNDFCIAKMARAMGKAEDAEKYLKRSQNWINVFDASSRSILNLTGSPDEGDLVDSGFRGFVQPRYTNGTFGYQDPALCSPMLEFTGCYLNPGGHETYEGGAWLYTFYVPHDQATLIKALGGPGTFVRRLEYFHNTPGLFYLGDEQSYLLLFLFHYAGRPGLSAQYVHKYIPSAYNDTLNGIPGNDDSGAMGSFVALVMMGIFPVGGQDVYLLVPPFFREASITNPHSGKTATIRSHGFDDAYKNIYIQSAKMNGKPYTKSWITHSFFTEGGLLELTLGSRESPTWGTRKADLPPSAPTQFQR